MTGALRAAALAGLGALLAGCVAQPYRPIGYTMPSAAYYAPPPRPQIAPPRPAPAPVALPDPDPDYETPPEMLQPLAPLPYETEAAPQPIPAAAPQAPAPAPPSGGTVPLMGFRPMRGQTPGAL